MMSNSGIFKTNNFEHVKVAVNILDTSVNLPKKELNSSRNVRTQYSDGIVKQYSGIGASCSAQQLARQGHCHLLFAVRNTDI